MKRTVLVTGGGRGLGHCIVRRHFEMGDRVFALDRRITDELGKMAQDADGITALECDISSAESVAKAAEPILKAVSRLDIVYNVAGIYRFEDKVNLAETDLDLCMYMYSVNAVGALRVVRAVWPLIQDGPVIINISSEAGSIGACKRDGEYAYCMSKAALNMGSKILQNEFRKMKNTGRVINLHPGWLRTVMGGPGAAASDRSVAPEDSARDIVGIALDAGSFPEDLMYMEHTREPLPW